MPDRRAHLSQRCRFYGETTPDGFRVTYGRCTARYLAQRCDRIGVRRADGLARREALGAAWCGPFGMRRAGVCTCGMLGSRGIRRHATAGPLEPVAEMVERRLVLVLTVPIGQPKEVAISDCESPPS